MSVTSLPTAPPAASQRRAIAVLFAAAGLMNAAIAAASPVSTLIAAERWGAALAAAPNTAAIIGTGAGAVALSRARERWGWRAGLVAGYAAAAAGGALTMAAAIGGHAVVLCAGMLLIGLGNAGALLSRYAAAEHQPAGRRGFAIGVVVWAGALGAVGGPLLLAPAGEVGARLGWVAFAGPFLLAAVAGMLAAVATLALPRRHGHAGLPREGGKAAATPARQRDGGNVAATPARLRDDRGAQVRGGRVRTLVRTPAARWAFAVMAAAQVVMGAVMTAAPLGIHEHHDGLGVVGAALSAHALGMFALSPLTGWLIDRVGARPVMLAGLVTMLVATVQLAIAPHDEALRVAALFQLGYGWNLCFVGGSGSLATGLPEADRAGVEGAVDGAVWGLAAVAALASTAAYATGGYPLIAAASTTLLALVAVRHPRAAT
ncbi:MFS transporter [Phytohabitans houttuyneae]|uniref:MFS transporter n=1 Tax=Phytohabitans houttuyneae TaxID=1076126 RepID=A0A6V8KV17_9ACTN|nr:MFS transporter [Phytohabitans houttuyneae]GFJ86231.1 MFS transporter [Phytohabitans houttuyneae]